MQKGYDTLKGNSCGLFGLEWTGMVDINTLKGIAEETGLTQTQERHDKMYWSPGKKEDPKKDKDE